LISDKQEPTNPLIDAEFFWYSINEGDFIVLETDFFQDHELVLRRGREYEVLSKIQKNVSDISFVVQSDYTNELICVHPYVIGDYRLMTDTRSLN
jgi:hypothetical protein